MSIADLFEISDDDTVWEAWLTTVNLVDMLEHAPMIGQHYDFAEARDKIARIYRIAEFHAMDKKVCTCGISDAEHALLKRKILTFFKLQVSNLKHFLS